MQSGKRFLNTVSVAALFATTQSFYSSGQVAYANYAEVNAVLMPWQKRYKQMWLTRHRRSMTSPHVGAKQKSKYDLHPERWETLKGKT